MQLTFFNTFKGLGLVSFISFVLLKSKVMKNKIWTKTVISTKEQNVEIYPTEGFDGIIVETRELDDKTLNGRLYLSKDEMELMIIKMQEMMKYVLEK